MTFDTNAESRKVSALTNEHSSRFCKINCILATCMAAHETVNDIIIFRNMENKWQNCAALIYVLFMRNVHISWTRSRELHVAHNGNVFKMFLISRSRAIKLFWMRNFQFVSFLSRDSEFETTSEPSNPDAGDFIDNRSWQAPLKSNLNSQLGAEIE